MSDLLKILNDYKNRKLGRGQRYGFDIGNRYYASVHVHCLTFSVSIDNEHVLLYDKDKFLVVYTIDATGSFKFYLRTWEIFKISVCRVRHSRVSHDLTVLYSKGENE